ncbi:hypothetical protein ATCCBAA256_10100 [Mycobacterium montefiorense]|nr:hypothetical protein ATCCBAA256_10100 [Mycobacterium montefiorense]
MATVNAAARQAPHQGGYQAKLGSTLDTQDDRDPDAAHARPLLIRLAVAALLFLPLADLAVMYRGASHPIHRVAKGFDRAYLPDRNLGGMADPPRCDSQCAPT